MSIFWSLDSIAKVCAIKGLDRTCKCLYFGIFWSLDSIAWTGRASVYILEFVFNCKSLCHKMYGQDVQVSIFWSLDPIAKGS